MWSWLGSPAVGLLGFLATVLTIIQCCNAAAKWLHEKSRNSGQSNHLLVVAIGTSLIATVIMSILSWSTIVTIVEKGGTHGFLAVIYPVMIYGLSLTCCLALSLSLGEKEPPPVFPSFAIMVSLAFGSVVYIGSISDRQRYLIAIVPGIAIIANLILLLSRLITERHQAAASDAATESLGSDG
jgi:tetrahydromethanopterin S-methyltransferase subunit E